MISVPMNALTNLERAELVKNNTKLVKYVYSSHIASYYKSIAEYEDFISAGKVGLVKAANGYNGSTKFITYACICIKNEMMRLVRRSFAKERIPASALVSLDAPIPDTSELSYSDIISDYDNTQAACIKLDIITFMKKLTDRDKSIFEQHILGTNQEIIARNVGLSQPVISRRIKKLQNKFKEFYYG